MANTLIYLDPDSPLNLQNQLRQKLVDEGIGLDDWLARLLQALP